MITFERLQVPPDLSELVRWLIEQVFAAGQGDEKLPSLIKIFHEQTGD